jgi:hypothetical protein
MGPNLRLIDKQAEVVLKKVKIPQNAGSKTALFPRRHGNAAAPADKKSFNERFQEFCQRTWSSCFLQELFKGCLNLGAGSVYPLHTRGVRDWLETCSLSQVMN